MRLVRHLAPGYSPKAAALRQTVRSQFQANKNEKDATKIESMKADAMRALSNYMLFNSAKSDTRLQKAMKDQVKSAKDDSKDEKR